MCFLHAEFWKNPWLVIVFMASLSGIVFIRYFLFATLYEFILRLFYGQTRNVFSEKRKQVRREISWALVSSVVFTGVAACCLYAYQQGWTRIYDDLQFLPLWYFFASGILFILAYETYYYWLHRLMHHPRIFRIVHKVHHESLHPTVFTSFSFHPLEALLQFLFFPAFIMLIPIHYIMLGGVLMIFTLSALINHSGTEIFRSKFLLTHFIGATHHDLHHKEFRSNFGLYLTWWDRWMGTGNTRNPS